MTDRDSSEAIPIPTIDRGSAPTIPDRVEHLTIKVDRLIQTNKLLKWVAMTAITFALGSAIAVVKAVYGMGVDDQVIKNGIERAQRQADEVKAELRELQRFVYRRLGFDSSRQPKED